VPQNILILSPFFYPEPISTGKYNGLVAEGLAGRGANVAAICSYPIYPDWVPKPAARELPGVLTIRGGGWLRYPQKPLLRRAVLEPWYAFHCAVEMLRLGRKADRVVAVFPPSLFMLLVPLMARRGAKIIGIVHDLQGVYAARKTGIAAKFLQSGIGWVEKRAFAACQHLVFLSESMRDVCVQAYGLDARHTSVHYPFVTIPDELAGADAELDSFFAPDLKSMVYSGALGEKQAPDKLVDLMIKVLDRHPDWQARVFSQGPIYERLKATVQHDRLAFFPLVEARLLPALLRRSDVQLVPQDTGTSDGSLPSKMPNIIAAGTRLLCITDPSSELQRLVNSYPAGVACTSWDASDTISAFEQVIQLPRATREQSDALLKQFTLDGLIDRLLTVGAST
jgi:colanic acid biosynthesis glycosyl transferase WcaI